MTRKRHRRSAPRRRLPGHGAVWGVVLSALALGLCLLCTTASARPRTLNVGVVRCATTTKHLGPGRLAAFCRLIDRHPELDVLVAPEWFLVPSGGTHSLRDVKRIRRVLRHKTRGKDLLVLPGTIAWSHKGHYINSTLAVSGGKVLRQYSKRVDGGDRSFGITLGKWWRAGSRPGIFRWRGLTVGVEICNDHFRGKMASEKTTPLDLYVVTAAARADRMYPGKIPSGLEGVAVYCNGGTGPYAKAAEVIERREGRTVRRLSESDVYPEAPKVPLTLSVFAVTLDRPTAQGFRSRR